MTSHASEHVITDALVALRMGDPGAMERLVPAVYEELKRLARGKLRHEHADTTLTTTGVVHEAWLRLVEQSRVQWVDRKHFFAVAAQAMRRVLVDHARRYRAAARGGHRRRTLSLETLDHTDPGALAAEDRADLLLGLDEALERLSALDPRQAQVVELRFFGGLTVPEVADTLEVTSRTVERDWVKARGWLYEALGDDD
jgi:RNA polymerase sigma-70 factor (ECF subfamily)